MNPWKDIPKQYEGRWTYDYDEKRAVFFVHCGGHRIADAEDSEVAHAICLAHNDYRVSENGESDVAQLEKERFKAKVRAMRETLGLTQAEVASRVGLERTSVVNIEAGRQRVLLDDVEKFAKGFGTTPKHFLKGIWF